LDLSVREFQILGTCFIKELDRDFTDQEVKKFIMSMKNKKQPDFVVTAEAWKVLSKKNDRIGILMNLFNQFRNKQENLHRVEKLLLLV
jgi:hypothetical protein